MKRLTLTLTIVFSGFVASVQSQRFIQQPQDQHVLIGRNSTFSCIAESAIDIIWHAYFPNGTDIRLTYETVGVSIKPIHPTDNQITAAVTIVTTQSWNNTVVKCYAIAPGSWSDSAYIRVYTSLRPLPPSQLHIASINTSTFIASWIPTLLWDDYMNIDYYNISIARSGSSTLLLSTSVDLNIYTFSDYSHPQCSEFEFQVSAVSREYGESNKSVIVGGFNLDVDEITQELNAITNVYFRSNGSPIVDIIIQLPTSVCSYQNVTVNSSILNGQGTELIHLEPSTSQGPDNIKSRVKHGLLKDQNYTLKVTVTSAGESSFSSTFTNFDTKLSVNPHASICSKSPKENSKDILLYKIAIGACFVVAVSVGLILIAAVVCLFVYKRRKMKRVNIDDSTSRVCNAMVHNPIYDGPVYESIQPKFDTLTSATKRAASISNTSSLDQPYDSQPSTPTSSEKSVRYVDPPTSAQASKTRSKSFLSHPSVPQGDNENIPRSTSVSVPVIKKTGKQRNKLNLTLTLTGTDSAGTTGSHHAQNSTTELISAVNPIVLRDVDENYTMMSRT